MSFAPSQREHAGIALVRPANGHNDAVKRIYENWTPEDLTVLERQPLIVRRQIVSMVRADYAQVIYTTSRLLLYFSAAYVRRGLSVAYGRRKPSDVDPCEGQLWRTSARIRFIRLIQLSEDGRYFTVRSCGEDGLHSWDERFLSVTHIIHNYIFVRDLP